MTCTWHVNNSQPDRDQISDIRQALRRPLPGLAGQMQMMPQPRPGMERGFDPAHCPREGGVLVLLYPKAGELTLVLTRRADTLHHHRGQVSFPGGARESGDADFVQTALREAQEELGIQPENLTILGTLTPLYIPPSDYRIYPAVAYTPQRPDFRPDPCEVALVLEMPLAELTSGRNIHTETWELRGYPVEVPFFEVDGHKVWGATAMVLGEFRALMRSAAIPSPQPLAEQTP